MPMLLLAAVGSLVAVLLAARKRSARGPLALFRRASSEIASFVTAPLQSKRSAAVLAEIAATERAYLLDLRVLLRCQQAFPEVPLGNVVGLEMLHAELAATLGIEADAPSSAAT